MTEEEWLTACDPTPMLESLKGKVSDRKMLTFAATCQRRAWRLLDDDRSRKGVEALEALVSGEPFDSEGTHLTTGDELLILYKGATVFGMTFSIEPEYAVTMAMHSVDVISIAEAEAAGHSDKKDVLRAYPPLIREVFGNPFRPVAVDPSWLTSTVTTLAEGIYTDRAFDRLPILADALQDVGCDNEDILSHCRQPGGHVRGCWVVDLLTGRA